jgi:hypothetical protein
MCSIIQALTTETRVTIRNFIFENILCRWGAVKEIIIDSRIAFIVTVKHLVQKYGIYHIWILVYNSCTNSLVERQHYPVKGS